MQIFIPFGGPKTHDLSGRDDKVVVVSRVYSLKTTTDLSFRPERTRISYFTAVDNGHVCDSPQREAHEVYRSH
jgi:hypothetical protein